MSDLKISQLTALTAVAADGADVLPVVDTSATTTKKMSLTALVDFVAAASVITNLIPVDSDELVEGATNLYYTSARSTLKANAASPTFTGTVTLASGASIEGASGTPVVIHGIELATGHMLRFEGSTANDFETFLTVVDPTADRTITFPNASGTVALTSDIGSVVWEDDQNILASSIFS